MLKRFSRLSIKHQLLSGFLLVVIALGFQSLRNADRLIEMNDDFNQGVRVTNPAIIQFLKISLAVESASKNLSLTLLTASPQL